MIVFDCCTHGLANRLRALFGFMALSRVRETSFALYWAAGSRCNAEFSELFEPPAFRVLSKDEITAIRENSSINTFTSADWFDTIWAKYGKSDVDWPRFASYVASAFADLQPKATIVEDIDRFSASSPLTDAVGFHIRQTDNVAFYRRWQASRPEAFDINQTSTLNGFVAEIAKHVDAGPVFLSTDAPDVEREILKRFGSTVSVFPKNFRQPEPNKDIRTSSVRHALTEMLLLSQCRIVVGTYYSSFSKLSAIMGGAKYYEIRGADCVRNWSVGSVQRNLGRTRYSLSPADLRMVDGAGPL